MRHRLSLELGLNGWLCHIRISKVTDEVLLIVFPTCTIRKFRTVSACLFRRCDATSILFFDNWTATFTNVPEMRLDLLSEDLLIVSFYQILETCWSILQARSFEILKYHEGSQAPICALNFVKDVTQVLIRNLLLHTRLTITSISAIR